MNRQQRGNNGLAVRQLAFVERHQRSNRLDLRQTQFTPHKLTRLEFVNRDPYV